MRSHEALWRINCLRRKDICCIICAPHHPITHLQSSRLYVFVPGAFSKHFFLSRPKFWCLLCAYLTHSYSPIMQAEVRIDSQQHSQWLCTTKLYKCINATWMNTFMALCTPMAQWMSFIFRFSWSSFELLWGWRSFYYRLSGPSILSVFVFLYERVWKTIWFTVHGVQIKNECSLTFFCSCLYSCRPELAFMPEYVCVCVCQWAWCLCACLCCSAICCIGRSGLCTAGCVVTGIAR